MLVKCDCGSEELESITIDLEDGKKHSTFICKKCRLLYSWGCLIFHHGGLEIPVYACNQCHSANVTLESFGAGDGGRELVVICKNCGRINTTDGNGKTYKRYISGDGYKEFPAYMKGGRVILIEEDGKEYTL